MIRKLNTKNLNLIIGNVREIEAPAYYKIVYKPTEDLASKLVIILSLFEGKKKKAGHFNKSRKRVQLYTVGMQIMVVNSVVP